MFLTMTSSGTTHPEAMLKRFMYRRSQINTILYGRNWRKKDSEAMSAVIGMERHKSGNPHSHILLRFPGGFPAGRWLEFRNLFSGWDPKVGKKGTHVDGFCRLEAPDDQDHVVSYTTKYVCKEGDVILTENFRALTPQGKLEINTEEQ